MYLRNHRTKAITILLQRYYPANKEESSIYWTEGMRDKRFAPPDSLASSYFRSLFPYFLSSVLVIGEVTVQCKKFSSEGFVGEGLRGGVEGKGHSFGGGESSSARAERNGNCLIVRVTRRPGALWCSTYVSVALNVSIPFVAFVFCTW